MPRRLLATLLAASAGLVSVAEASPARQLRRPVAAPGTYAVVLRVTAPPARTLRLTVERQAVKVRGGKARTQTVRRRVRVIDGALDVRWTTPGSTVRVTALTAAAPQPSRALDRPAPAPAAPAPATPAARPAASAKPSPTPEPDNRVESWLTTTGGGTVDAALVPGTQTFERGSGPKDALLVDPGTALQEIDGFGAALTDASAWLIARSPARDAIMREFFAPDRGGFSVLRLPMGASDLSRSLSTYDDTCCDLSDFSVTHDDAYVVPLLRQARALNPQLKIIATPWSAPGWMKFGGTLTGACTGNANFLRNELYGTYAQYFVRFLQEYAARGIPIHAFSLQNEPGHCDPTYPTMTMSVADQAALSAAVRPALDAAGFGAVKLIGYEHNWYTGGAPSTVPMDLLARPEARIDAIAYHCYESPAAGAEAQSALHAAFPATEIHFTECAGGAWAPDQADNFVWNLRHTLIAPLRHWARTSLYWPLALDEHGGPNIGGCGTCRGAITVRSDGTYTHNAEYDAWTQLSRFVRPGARRLPVRDAAATPAVAFRNPDGTTVLVTVNAQATQTTVTVADGARHVRHRLPGRAALTLRWR